MKSRWKLEPKTDLKNLPRCVQQAVGLSVGPVAKSYTALCMHIGRHP